MPVAVADTKTERASETCFATERSTAKCAVEKTVSHTIEKVPHCMEHFPTDRLSNGIVHTEVSYQRSIIQTVF